LHVEASPETLVHPYHLQQENPNPSSRHSKVRPSQTKFHKRIEEREQKAPRRRAKMKPTMLTSTEDAQVSDEVTRMRFSFPSSSSSSSSSSSCAKNFFPATSTSQKQGVLVRDPGPDLFGPSIKTLHTMLDAR